MEKNGTKEEKPLIIYGHRYCSQANLLRESLDQKQIRYEWRDIREGDPIFQDELKSLARGNLSVPTVVLPTGTVLIEPLPRQVIKLLKPPGGFLSKLANFFNPQPE